jgi:hypothetical protein
METLVKDLQDKIFHLSKFLEWNDRFLCYYINKCNNVFCYKHGNNFINIISPIENEGRSRISS